MRASSLVARYRFTIKLARQQIIYGYDSGGDRSFNRCKYCSIMHNATNSFWLIALK
ncbi:MAG: hypothetical protein ACYTXC_23075 [Nostoc sp.]